MQDKLSITPILNFRSFGRRELADRVQLLLVAGRHDSAAVVAKYLVETMDNYSGVDDLILFNKVFYHVVNERKRSLAVLLPERERQLTEEDIIKIKMELRSIYIIVLVCIFLFLL